ncbi:MAG: Uma2 family endonuclease [Planctomycetes bacterium]|nr:Uma2 family endonuclease [Planctomycetota bacterium]
MSAVPRCAPQIPPLQPGDHLTVEEFERRYQAMPELKKAELIEGVVYMPSPVTIEEHGSPQAKLIGWLIWYEAFTPGVQVGDNSTVRMKVGSNQPQPDALLRILPDCSGQSQTSEDGYVVSAPELVAEISVSTASYDLHEKLKAYERNSVLEYIIWRVADREIDWFFLRGGKFKRLTRSSDGAFKSKCFPGLWLNPTALIENDLATVLRVLQQGLASEEHHEFVERLAKEST